MLTQFFTIFLLMLFSAMLPGPDFALVTKNTLFHSRRSGLYTALGIGTAILVHITYCASGVAILIAESLLLFSIVKYVGACYLVYLGIKLLVQAPLSFSTKTHLTKSRLSNWSSFRQGFLCNLLNPKATLFFLTLFTLIIKPETPIIWIVIYAIEMFIIITAWFCSLTFILSHPKIVVLLKRLEKYISKTLGVFLIGFGIVLAFARR